MGYVRVSSSMQRDDLERWKQLMASYAKGEGYGGIQILSDIGSGLNEGEGLPKASRNSFRGRGSRIIVAYEDYKVWLRNIEEALLSLRSRSRGGKP